ncbi:rod shape-determining protein MreC [Hasllibacter halocynthiae]|uniref:Cell shape-determining protein MreC n=1 Tax=Hasllibacter halocynthiae TaxID=595589 RepID=A0A2T0X9T0_9RHOB|nr:rod shape-determining protein MreC [Hasllibacter halocynthiae]PRY95700.1 rod shape-determining protein MreC [Hasllibacter halocynthiae]
MARKPEKQSYARPIGRIFAVGAIGLCLLIFVIWRIDSPRVERLRAQIVDRVVPNMDWAMAPMTAAARMVGDFQSYARIYEQNRELRRELQQMQAWREAALQLEQQNARLLDLNNVRLDPRFTWITGRVLADSGSPFRQSVLLNVGARDGIGDGWAAMDGLGLVGRISGTGQRTARAILLTDATSRVPVTIQPSGQNAIIQGDNTSAPVIGFLEDDAVVRPGDRIVTSGDGDVFPSGVLVGQVAVGRDGLRRARLSADMDRLEFLRVLRARPAEGIEGAGRLVLPAGLPQTRDEVDAEIAGEAPEDDVDG